MAPTCHEVIGVSTGAPLRRGGPGQLRALGTAADSARRLHRDLCAPARAGTRGRHFGPISTGRRETSCSTSDPRVSASGLTFAPTYPSSPISHSQPMGEEPTSAAATSGDEARVVTQGSSQTSARPKSRHCASALLPSIAKRLNNWACPRSQTVAAYWPQKRIGRTWSTWPSAPTVHMGHWRRISGSVRPLSLRGQCAIQWGQWALRL